MNIFRGLIENGERYGLFQNISTNHSDEVNSVYNAGVRALSAGKVQTAIEAFSSIADKHPSAAYNLGLIYLHGGGLYIPDYDLARQYFQLADNQGHDKARESARIIGLTGDRHIVNINEYHLFLKISSVQAALGKQFGNLAYVIANDIIYNVVLTSINQQYSAKRFIDYEVWCIRKYASKSVERFYLQSSLTEYNICYHNDWDNGETAIISDYFNTKILANIIGYADGAVDIAELGIPRLIAVDYIYKYFSQKWNADLI